MGGGLSYSATFAGSVFSQWKKTAPCPTGVCSEGLSGIPASRQNKLPCCTAQKGLSIWRWTAVQPASQRCATFWAFALGLFWNSPRASCIRGMHPSTELHLWAQFPFFLFLFRQFIGASNFPRGTDMTHYQSVRSPLQSTKLIELGTLKIGVRKIR